jgi:hypothetical protein
MTARDSGRTEVSSAAISIEDARKRADRDG